MSRRRNTAPAVVCCLLAALGAAACDSSGSPSPSAPPSTSVPRPASSAPVPQSSVPQPPAPSSGTAAPVPGAEAWSKQVATDLGPLVTDAVPIFRDAQAWADGDDKVTAKQVRDAIASAMPDLRTSLAAIRARKPLAGAPETVEDYRLAILLYLAAFRVEYTATGLPAGALRTQLQNSYVRLRLLGDRIYDQGTARLRLPSVIDDPGLRPAAVPDWAGQDLLPAAPLITGTIPAAGPAVAAGRTQPDAAWTAAVRAADVPAQDRLPAAFADASGRTAQQVAIGFLRAGNALAPTPAPAGDPVQGPLTRLGLLTDAEAALLLSAAGQDLPPTSARSLRVAASITALAGYQLWDSARLGARTAPVTGDAYALAADAPLG